MNLRFPQSRVSTKSGNWITVSVLVVAGTLIVFHFNRVATAGAHAADVPQAMAARQVIDNYLDAEQGRFADLPTTLGNTDALLQECLADRSGAQVPLASLHSDPFRFAAATQSIAAEAATEKKSDTDRVAMLQDLQKLRLQSIVAGGDNPQCMIDDRLYHAGEQVGNFTIERIDAAVVVVRNGGYRFELKIAG
jgi:hypothetical protein